MQMSSGMHHASSKKHHDDSHAHMTGHNAKSGHHNHDMDDDNGNMGSATENIHVTSAMSAGDRKMHEVMMKTSRFGDVVTGKEAQEQQFTTLNDYSYKVPGFRPNTTTPHYSRMSIRGLGQPLSGSAGIGYLSETAFSVDNVTWLQPDYQAGDWSNISSFEIGYGPGGTAGGHNSDVGVISIMTALPSFKRSTQYEQTVGNYGHTIEKLDSTGSILRGHLAYRITGYYDNANGWIHDILNGKRYQNINRGGVRAQLLATEENYTDRFIFSYNGSSEYSQYGESAGTGGASAPIGDSVLVYGNGRYAGSYAATLASRLNKSVLTYNPYRPALADPGKERSNVYTASNELNYHIGRNTLTSISAVGLFSGVNSGTTDNQNVWIGTGGEMDDYGVQGSQEIRLASPQEDKIAWTVGLYGVDNSAWNRMHHTAFGTDAAAWYSRPAAVTGLTQWEKNYNTNIQAAIFAQTVIHVNNKFSLTLGLRNSYDIQKFNNKFEVGYVPGTAYSYDQQRQALRA
ncbi:TonB-dependent receptor [Novacetimonas hansenii]